MELKRPDSVTATTKSPPIYPMKWPSTRAQVTLERVQQSLRGEKIRREQAKEERESAGGNNSGMTVRCRDYWSRSRSIRAHRPHSATAAGEPSENSLRPGSNRGYSIPHPAEQVVRNAPSHGNDEGPYADSRRVQAKLAPALRSEQPSRATRSTAEIWQ
jgi:hypothetical protein